MKEASYGSRLADDIEKQIGGKVSKISDRVGLGRPDNMHVHDGVITFIETKIGEQYELEQGVVFVQPWKVVKKDIRQYEVCKLFSRHALTVYAIYWPAIKMTLVLTMEQIAALKPKPNSTEIPWLSNSQLLMPGRGITQLKRLMNKNRKDIYAHLQNEID